MLSHPAATPSRNMLLPLLMTPILFHTALLLSGAADHAHPASHHHPGAAAGALRWSLTKDTLEKLPAWPNRRRDELLPAMRPLHGYSQLLANRGDAAYVPGWMLT